MFGSSLPRRAALIAAIAVGALGLALAVGASAAYLVSPSYDERPADKRPASVSADTRTRVGAPAARGARAVTAPRAKPGERSEEELRTLGVAVRGNGSPSGVSAGAAGVGRTPSASATAGASVSASASEAAVLDTGPPSRARAEAAGLGRPTAASATANASSSAREKPPATTTWRSWWWRS